MEYTIPNYSAVRFQREAYKTWQNFYDSGSTSNRIKNYINGTLSCFCNNEYEQNGWSVARKTYRADGLDQSESQLQSHLDKLDEKGLDDTTQESQICRAYIISKQFSSWYYWIVSIFIILYNYLFFTLTKPILSKVGFHLRTQEQRLISLTVSVCLFIDSIVLPLLIGANFIEYPDSKFLNSVIRGKNTDFGDYWYKDVGVELVTIMILFVFSPLIDFVTEWIELSLHRMYARKYLYTEEV